MFEVYPALLFPMASAVCPLLLFWRFSACFGVFAVLAEPPLFSSLLAVHLLVCSSPFVATDRESGTSSYPRFAQVQEMPGKVQAQKHHIFLSGYGNGETWRKPRVP
jgi:hypothetical protein